MKILHIVPYFPPDRLGGVGEVAAHVHRALLERGHDSRVLTTGTTRDDPRVLRVARSPEGFVLAAPFQWRQAIGMDVIHVHQGEAVGLVAVLRLLEGLRVRRDRSAILLTLHASALEIRRSLRPVTVEGHSFGSRIGLIRRAAGLTVRHFLDRCAIALADRVSFISRSSARDFLGSDADREATVVYNGLPEISVEEAISPGRHGREVESERDDAKGAPEPVELLFVGVYNLRKRVQLLPFVLKRVREVEPDARLRLIGFRAEDHPEIVELARELGVKEGMVFEGRMRSDELPPYYRAARVLLVPSAYEGLPMVVMEGFQNSLPVVATRVSGHPEIIESGVDGFLVDVDDPNRMADAVLEILGDPELARSMGESGRKRVQERFGVERQVDEYLALYKEMASVSAHGFGGAPPRSAAADRTDDG